ncbi:hypothetical protein ASZ78_012561 [Callipepla squamata]|uniref:glucuronosyltransferase n=1 Tax=Callipepla squamata TaxID=9009 RepID=A0A226MIM7_CALSU|nr:hypothetical protein ASZ78_012561 [Callipepla squamata]
MSLRLCYPLAACVFILLIPGLSEGGKLLVVPMVGSHWLSMKEVVQKLAERGHEVVVLKPEVSWQTGEGEKYAYSVKTYPGHIKLEELDNAFQLYVATHLKGLPFPQNVLALYNAYKNTFETFYVQCRELFSSTETLQYLNQSGFDAVLTDPIFMCGPLLAHYLSLPFVFFMRGLPCDLHFGAAQCPSPISYVPRIFSFNSDHMTFFQRVENALISLLELFYCNGYYRAALQLSSEVLQRDASLIDLLNNASISLMRFDFVFEYPRPTMPNMVFIGGINCAQKKPLAKHLNPLPLKVNSSFSLEEKRRRRFHGQYSVHRKMSLRLCYPLAACIFILLIPGLSEGGKLLVVPMVGSHWLSMKEVVQELAERGHEVVVLKPEVSWQMKEAEKHAYTVKTYPVSTKLEELDNAFQLFLSSQLKRLPFPENLIAPYKNTVHLFKTFYHDCRDLFSSTETLQYLKQSGFDAVLTDPFFMCGATVANYLSLPFVFFMRGFPCSLHYEAAQSPSPLSYVPRFSSMNSGHMTFFQRVENALISLFERSSCDGFYQDAIQFSSEVLQRDVSLIDLLNNASIWLLRYDFVFEYPRPVMPNMIFIGGLNCALKKPLPEVCSWSPIVHFPKKHDFVASGCLIFLIFFFFAK